MTRKMLENYEGLNIYIVKFNGEYGMPTEVFSLGEDGVNQLCDMFDMTYTDTMKLSKNYNVKMLRIYEDGNVSSPHMDFETLDDIKAMIDSAKSANILNQTSGKFEDEELSMEDKVAGIIGKF